MCASCGTANRIPKYNRHLIGSFDRLDVSDRRFAGRNLVSLLSEPWVKVLAVVGFGVYNPGVLLGFIRYYPLDRVS